MWGTLSENLSVYLWPLTMAKHVGAPPSLLRDTTATSGPISPYYRGLTITLRHNTLGSSPLDEWSARRRDLYLTTYNTHKRHPCPGGIQTRIPSKRAAADPRFRPGGHWDRPSTGCTINKCLWLVYFIVSRQSFFNPLTPNDHYSGRTATLTSKCCILYIYSTNIGTEYFKHGIYCPFYSLQNAVCFIILTYLVPYYSHFIYRVY